MFRKTMSSKVEYYDILTLAKSKNRKLDKPGFGFLQSTKLDKSVDQNSNGHNPH